MRFTLLVLLIIAWPVQALSTSQQIQKYAIKMIEQKFRLPAKKLDVLTDDYIEQQAFQFEKEDRDYSCLTERHREVVNVLCNDKVIGQFEIKHYVE